MNQQKTQQPNSRSNFRSNRTLIDRNSAGLDRPLSPATETQDYLSA